MRAFEPLPSSATVSKLRLGRSKPEWISAGSRMPIRSAISLGHLRGGGRGAGHDRRPAESFGYLRETQIVGPEIVAPLGEAVGLVDRQQVDFAANRSA